ncbi:MAG: ATP-binding protein [Candidatus Hydrogenedentota bacterium]|nr:MAG: ATP-binding protein [Candidatus Hydrogenedentota bacterium]
MRSVRYAPVVVVTGARRTGKTSLVRRSFPRWSYRNLDSVTERLALGRLETERFRSELCPAILDEIQKAPRLLDKVKFAVDEAKKTRFLITGSAQILLMRRIRESLAGRVRLLELFPLGLAERSGFADKPLLTRLLAGRARPARLLKPLLGSRPLPKTVSGRDEMEAWGGMPEALLLPKMQKRLWLEDYVKTYLERDLADLARLEDITTFSNLQRLLAAGPAQVLSFSRLARDCGTRPPTVKRYIGYLSLSYQAFLLRPWLSNVRKRVVKSPHRHRDPAEPIGTLGTAERPRVRKLGDRGGLQDRQDTSPRSRTLFLSLPRRTRGRSGDSSR